MTMLKSPRLWVVAAALALAASSMPLKADLGVLHAKCSPIYFNACDLCLPEASWWIKCDDPVREAACIPQQWWCCGWREAIHSYRCIHCWGYADVNCTYILFYQNHQDWRRLGGGCYSFLSEDGVPISCPPPLPVPPEDP
jgi:hypothetical protein